MTEKVKSYYHADPDAYQVILSHFKNWSLQSVAFYSKDTFYDKSGALC